MKLVEKLQGRVVIRKIMPSVYVNENPDINFTILWWSYINPIPTTLMLRTKIIGDL